MKFLVLIHFTFLISVVFAQGLINLGPSINTPDHTESTQVISPDGKTLYFTRSEDGYNIYYSEQNQDGSWTKAVPLDELNNNMPNKVYFISPDNSMMIINGTYGPNPEDKGLSYTLRGKEGWSEPVKLKFENEGNITWGNNACTISSNGRIMILSLSKDLYVSFKKGENLWSEPKKLPDNVNTDKYEYTPFLGLDDKTLYFSSNGHGGLGLNDIVKTTRLDSTWLNWSDPVNLGEPVNSEQWESFFRLDASGEYAYVLSRKEGKGDLYRVKMKEESKPQPVVLLKGRVLNKKTNEPIYGAEINYELLSNGESVGTAQSDFISGSYNIILNYGSAYSFSAESEGFIGLSDNLDISNINKYTIIEKDLYLSPIETGSVVRMNNIFFDLGKSNLNTDSFSELNRISTFLIKNPTISIEIGGHTDDIGSLSSNNKLSLDRANSVKEYIVSQGIRADRITTKGYGPSKPEVPNDSDENRQLNRRVEFTILGK